MLELHRATVSQTEYIKIQEREIARNLGGSSIDNRENTVTRLQHRQKPVQDRARETEQRLLDALEALLVQRSFAELTVAELAREANVTTGAIYRRFVDKEDVLRVAFQRFLRRSAFERSALPPAELTDRQLIKWHLERLKNFLSENRHFIQAANDLNGSSLAEVACKKHPFGSERLAEGIQASALTRDVLAKKTGFVLHVAAAAIGAAMTFKHRITHQGCDDPSPGQESDQLIENLTDVVCRYLELAEE